MSISDEIGCIKGGMAVDGACQFQIHSLRVLGEIKIKSCLKKKTKVSRNEKLPS